LQAATTKAAVNKGPFLEKPEFNRMKTTNFCQALVGLLVSLCLLPGQGKAQITLKSVGVGLSYYKPTLDYWNQRSMLSLYNNDQGASFSGKAMPTAALEVGLWRGLSAGLRVGYWKNSVSGALRIGGIERTETLSLAIIPVSLDLTYRFEPTTGTGKTPLLTPYAGVGLSRYFIKNDFSRQVVNNPGSVSESQTGNSYGLQVFVGAERKLVGKLSVGLDVRYHLGSYNQATGETPASTEKVSLNGLEAGLALRLKLAP